MNNENQNIEWKSTWKDNILNTVCGMANNQGGKIYIGVDDNGNILGINDSRELLEILPSKIRDAMGIVVNINLLKDKKLEYLEIDVPSYLIAISCKGNYYYRSGSTTQKLTGVELESFILRKRGATWDNVPHPQVLVDDLDLGAIDHFKKLATRKKRIDSVILEEEPLVLLDKLHLINNGYLTNAALLLFSKDPERYFTGAFIKVGFFENDADLLYQDEVRGSLFEQIDKVIELIHFKYMKAKMSYDGLQRVEQYFVTEESMREAILNAIVHKRYESGVPVQISVYNDKLYISNVGRLPENWTKESLYEKHSSIPYNPNIAHVFYLAGHIESWGRGIEKMCNSCLENNFPLPIYHVNPSDIMIEFDAAKELVIDNFSGINNDNQDVKITDKELEVLNLLIEDPGYTAKILAEKVGVSPKTISKRIRSLKQKNIITRIGSDTKGYWKIKGL
ncbi:MAG: putative DNA binding domain-containing protein [Erysipelotrichaceae bacterium]|nr:putative DNA binding domain-containing protein [Erysipelotrichaceae bacterium]